MSQREGHCLGIALSLPVCQKLITKDVTFFSKDPLSDNCIEKAWEREINAILPDKIWRTALFRIYSCFNNQQAG